MPRAILFAVAALSLWPTVAGAVDATNFALKTTENLYLVCSAAANDPLRPEAINFCEDFLLGVVTYHDAISDRQHLKRFICYPPSATRDQGIAKLSFLAKSTTPSVQLPPVPQGYPDTSRTATYLVSARRSAGRTRRQARPKPLPSLDSAAHADKIREFLEDRRAIR